MIGQQFERGDSPFLLFSCETPPKVLCHPLRPPAQGRPGPDEKNPEKDHKDVHRAGTSLPWKKTEGLGGFQFGEKQALGRPHCSLSRTKEGEIFLLRIVVTGQGAIV